MTGKSYSVRTYILLRISNEFENLRGCPRKNSRNALTFEK